MPKFSKVFIVGALLLFGGIFSSAVLAMKSGVVWPGEYTRGAYVFSNSFLYGGSWNDVVVVAADRHNQPLAGQRVTVTMENSSARLELFNGTTDPAGVLAGGFLLPPQGNGATRKTGMYSYDGEVTITIRAGQETIRKKMSVFDMSAYRGGFGSSAAVNASEKPSGNSTPSVAPEKLYLTLDKPRYQPGQTIHLRTLAFRPGAASAGDVTYEITDPSNNKLFRKTLTANKFGITSLEYPIADILPLGDYKISVATTSSFSTKIVPIERYVTPKFDIRVSGLASWYTFSDIITGKIDANYFFGKPVQGKAMVTASYTQNIYDERTSQTYREFHNTTGDLSNGSGEIRISLGTLRTQYDTSVKIELTVTDTGGHTEKKNITCIVSNTPMYLTIIPETQVPGQTSTIMVLARDPSGMPARGATISASFGSPKTRDLAPVKTDDRGIARIEYFYNGESYLSVKGTIARGGSTDTASADYYIGAKHAVKVTTDKRFYDVGETVIVRISADPGDDFSGVTGNAIARVKLGGITFDERTIRFQDANASFSFQVTEAMVPTLEIEVSKITSRSYELTYSYYDLRMPGRTSGTVGTGDRFTLSQDRTAIGVGLSTQLNITVGASKTALRPGEQVELFFSVLDGTRPVESALAVAIVDEALLALGGTTTFEDLRADLMRDPGFEQYSVYSYIWGNGLNAMPTFTSGSFYDYRPDAGQLTYSSTHKEGSETNDQPSAVAIEQLAAVMGLFGVAGYFAVLGIAIKFRKTAIALVGLLMLIPALTPMVMNFVNDQPAPRLLGDTTSPVTFTETVSTTNSRSALEDINGVPSVAPPRVPTTAPAKNSGGGLDFFGGQAAPGGSGPGSTDTYSSVPGSLFAPSRTTTVRTWFPELWYWNPLVVTGTDGKASVTLNAPDSITTWRVDTLASTTDGKIGLGNGSLVVFQSFFVDPDLPVSVVRNDRFTFKVQIYNFEPSEKTVTVSLAPSDWFDPVSQLMQTVVVGANTVSWADFTIRARKVGIQNLTVSGSTAQREDIVIRELLVEPDGKLREDIRNGLLENASFATLVFNLDPRRIANSEAAYVKLQASVESIILDGAEEFIHTVWGCGEQSTSGLAVDILAYRNYLKGDPDPANLTAYQDIINKGIQHEAQYLSSNTGGHGRAIVWHAGEEPDLWLTAWAIQAYKELRDAGFTVDDKIIPDLQAYLSWAQQSDGSWSFPNVNHWSINSELQNQKLAATAYIVRALTYTGLSASSPSVERGRMFIEGAVGSEKDSFTLALCLDVLELAKGSESLRSSLAQKIKSAAKVDGQGAVHWSYTDDQGSNYRWHRSDNTIETTGYAVMALARRGDDLALVQGGAKYMVLQRGGGGYWGSTHNTAVAFTALNSLSEITGLKDIAVDVLVDGARASSFRITGDNKDLTFYTDLKPFFASAEGSVSARTVNVTVKASGEGGVFYHVYTKQNIEWASASNSPIPELNFSVNYSANSTQIGGVVAAHAKVAYIGPAEGLQMVLVELKAPVGFVLDQNDFIYLQNRGRISFYEYKSSRRILVYLDALKFNEPRTIDYSLTAMSAASTLLQHVKAWDMYNTSMVAELAPVAFSSA